MSKFFEAITNGAGDLNGVGLPFAVRSFQLPAASIGLLEPGSAEPRESCTALAPITYRTVSIRVPRNAPLLPFDGLDSSAAESYRIIRSKLVQHAARPRVICISSASAGDGKTVNALNLASSFALKKDTTAILVDVDMRRSQLAQLLNVPAGPGLAEVLSEQCAPQEAIVRVQELPNLFFLPAGRCRRNPAELLDSSSWRSLIDFLCKQFHFVVLDSPPVGIVADYDLIHSASDGVVLIARPGHSNRKLIQKGIEQAPKEKFLGVVLNCAEDWFLWRSNDRYYSYEHHD